MAHEIGHVRNYDIRLSMIVFGLVVAIGFIADMILRMTFFGGRGNNNQDPVVLIFGPRRAAHRAARGEPRAGRGLAAARVPRGCDGRDDDAASRRARERPREAQGLRRPMRRQNSTMSHLWITDPLQARRHRPPLRHAPADRRPRRAPRDRGRRVLAVGSGCAPRTDGSGSGRGRASSAAAPAQGRPRSTTSIDSSPCHAAARRSAGTSRSAVSAGAPGSRQADCTRSTLALRSLLRSTRPDDRRRRRARAASSSRTSARAPACRSRCGSGSRTGERSVRGRNHTTGSKGESRAAASIRRGMRASRCSRGVGGLRSTPAPHRQQLAVVFEVADRLAHGCALHAPVVGEVGSGRCRGRMPRAEIDIEHGVGLRRRRAPSNSGAMTCSGRA